MTQNSNHPRYKEATLLLYQCSSSYYYYMKQKILLNCSEHLGGIEESCINIVYFQQILDRYLGMEVLISLQVTSFRNRQFCTSWITRKESPVRRMEKGESMLHLLHFFIKILWENLICFWVGSVDYYDCFQTLKQHNHGVILFYLGSKLGHFSCGILSFYIVTVHVDDNLV